MTNKKLISALISITALAVSLLPVQASALSTASMTLAGSSNSTGSFDVTIFENTGADTVTNGFARLDFSGPVSNVTYACVAPFATQTPSGACAATGEVSGSQPVTVAHFVVSAPGTITATVSSASFLKHAIRDANGSATGSENFVISRGSATFTRSTPADGAGSGSTTASGSSSTKSTKVAATATTATNDSAATTNHPAADSAGVKAAVSVSTTQKTDQTESAVPGQSNTAAWILTGLLIVGLAILAFLRREQIGVWASNMHKKFATKPAPKSAKTAASKVSRKTTGKRVSKK